MARLKSLEEIMQDKASKMAKREGMTIDEAMEKFKNPFGVPDNQASPAEDRQDAPADTANADEALPSTAQFPDQAAQQSQRQDDEPPADDGGRALLEEENQRLKSQLSALQGRVAPEQQRNAALEAALLEERQRSESRMKDMQRQLDDAMAKLEEQRIKEFSVDELLSEEEKGMVDPAMLEVVKKISMAMAKQMAPKQDVDATIEAVLAKREQQQVEDYRNRVLSNPKHNVSRLLELANNDRFKEWADDNVDIRYAMSAFLHSKSREEVDAATSALNKRLGDFFEQTRPKNRQAPARTDAITTSLHSAMRRDSNDGKQTRQDFNRDAARIRDLSRSRSGRNSEEVKRLLKNLQSYN
ncbi:MAG: hypothetical protein NC080_07420 [Paraprevotella sp.]|nr:hypothetical protein [Paraprevotella sp.]